MIELADDGQIVQPHDAATVIVYRLHPQFEIFMVKRHARSKFMANAMVFPGGRLEPEDLADDWRVHIDISGDAARKRLNEDDASKARGLLVAAIRETFEEAAILLVQGSTHVDFPNSARLLRARDQLNAKETTFLDLVSAWGAKLTTDSMVYVSRWRTPTIEKRRFDARFFSIECPPQQLGQHDNKETTSSAWLNPAVALAEYDKGAIELAPPTLRILMACAADPSWLWQPRTVPIEAIEPQAMMDDDCFHLLLPGDQAFDPPGQAKNRVSRMNDRWISVGSGA